MSFFKSFFYGAKLYFFMSLAIGLGFFIEIQRNDLKGNIEGSIDYIDYSIDILTIVFPLFCFYVGSKQSNLIKRKTDSGFAAALSSVIGFFMLIYMNWGITLVSLWIADASTIVENSENTNIDDLNNYVWRVIPATFAGTLSAIINNTNSNKTQTEVKKYAEDEGDFSPTPWVYSIGAVDEHGFEWITHNEKKWYRAANSGDEWSEYST